MGCTKCGGKQVKPQKTPASEVQIPQVATSFQYTGATGLTAYGRDRRVYRFDSPGAIVVVEAHDVIMLSQIPLLRRV